MSSKRCFLLEHRLSFKSTPSAQVRRQLILDFFASSIISMEATHPSIDCTQSKDYITALPAEIRRMILCEVLISPRRNHALLIWEKGAAPFDRHVAEGLRVLYTMTPPHFNRQGIEALERELDDMKRARPEEATDNKPSLKASRAALMYTCRLFHGEGAEIYYGQNQFRFCLDRLSPLLEQFQHDMSNYKLYRGPTLQTATQTIVNIRVELIRDVRKNLLAFENLRFLHIRSAHTAVAHLRTEIAPSLQSPEWRAFTQGLPHLRYIRIDKDTINFWTSDQYSATKALFVAMNHELGQR